MACSPRSSELQGSIEKAKLQFDWRVEPDRIELCKHLDGSIWQLGAGAFGTVCLLSWAALCHVTVAMASCRTEDWKHDKCTVTLNAMQRLGALRALERSEH